MVMLVPLAETPPQPLPTRGRGLTQPRLWKLNEAQMVQLGFSPLVGEMAGRPEGVFSPEAHP